MKQCAECGAWFEPRVEYHRYCDACYAKRRGWVREPWDRWPLVWLRPDVWVWFLLVALPVIVVIAVGRQLGWW